MIKSEAKSEVIVVWRCPQCKRKHETKDETIVRQFCPFCEKAWMQWHIKYKGKEL